MSMFSDMVKDTIEVFMDDFSMLVNHLSGVLGHRISKKGIEVDRAKV